MTQEHWAQATQVWPKLPRACPGLSRRKASSAALVRSLVATNPGVRSQPEDQHKLDPINTTMRG